MSINTIFYIKGGGRFGNQLLTMVHLLAFSKEYSHLKLRIVHNGLVQYNSLIDSKRPIFYVNTAKGSSWPLFIRIILLLQNCGLVNFSHHFANAMAYSVLANPFKKFVKLKRVKLKDYQLSNVDFINKLTSLNKVVLWGWGFRCWDLVEKHYGQILADLLPRNIYFERAQKHIWKNIDNDNFIIAILIRHTDYRTWLDGRYYFTTLQYEKWIIETYEHYQNISTKCKFLICSDQIQNFELLEQTNIPYFLGSSKNIDGHYIEDFYEISLAHLILTAPSTFSGMAAFFGNIPVLLLREPNQHINIAEAKPNHIFDLYQDIDGKSAVN